MFGWFRKKPDLTQEVLETQKQCIAVFVRTWKQIHPPPVPRVNANELANEIDSFSATAFQFMFTKFPLTKHAPPSMLWLIIFTAVLEAKTHPTDLVNEAIDILREKYVH